MFKIHSSATVIVSAIILSACQPQVPASAAKPTTSADISQHQQYSFEGSDVRDAGLGGGDFSLLDGKGKSVHLRDFRGKVVALVFGYTHCPDVCPTNLLAYADAINQLGEKGKQVQVLFITLDPLRDTPQVMAEYAPAFNQNFIGLTVDKSRLQALNSVINQYKIAVHKATGSSAKDYQLDHSTGTFLLDKQGHTVVYEPHSQTGTQLAHDMKQLLD